VNIFLLVGALAYLLAAAFFCFFSWEFLMQSHDSEMETMRKKFFELPAWRRWLALGRVVIICGVFWPIVLVWGLAKFLAEAVSK
jgi:hypothetical protein